MANKLKKKVKNSPDKKPAKSDVKPFRPEKEEKMDLKAIARDERTWKIIGTISLLFAVFLFISFGSYLFTWKEDQAIAREGFSALLDNDKPVNNLLGRFGAVMSYFFIFNGFGFASFLICTFFFVVGVNLLFRRKVFSIWRNLKYVTLGLLVLSVSLSFIASVITTNGFPFGGAVGDMINTKLIGAIGSFGTGAVLVVFAVGYFIWQFNPSIKLPQQLEAKANGNEAGLNGVDVNPAYEEAAMNDQSAKEENKGNYVSADGSVVINFPDEQPLHDFKVVEKDEPGEEENTEDHTIEGSIEPEEDIDDEIVPPVKEKITKSNSDDPLELEIKVVPDKVEEEAEKVVENLPPYEPTLDLRDYKYPTLTLLEAHGSEKIIQDTNELQNNKNQIIETLKNYSIEIQKISATVGPTVTLYEIVPAPGVRISKIKNLEDDIALSLAALGIRIIAPIPGKGTIGIEVPNVRKTIVSMKSMLSSEKFQT